MNKILRKIIFAILLLPIVIIIVALFLPSSYHVERTVIIKAKPEDIFPYLNELNRWPEWTAWTTNRDPSLVFHRGDQTSGVGAIETWTARSGNGAIRLTASNPTHGISYQLNFNEGRFISHGDIQMLAVHDGTRVTWNNDGNFGRNPVGRYLGLLMDRMLGGDFEMGLQNLKRKVE